MLCLYTAKKRLGKVGVPRAYKAKFVGYHYSSIIEPVYKVIAVGLNGVYQGVRVSKDVIIDTTIDFNADDDDNLPTDHEFNIYSGDTAMTTTPTPTPSCPIPEPVQDQAPKPEPPDQDAEMDRLEEHYDNEGNQLYWYHFSCINFEYALSMVETNHHLLSMPVRDKRVPKNYDAAWENDLWRAAIIKEKENLTRIFASELSSLSDSISSL